MTKICFLAVGLAFIVVILGAYVRLSDAGLGCPDWPGCYGQITVPSRGEVTSPLQSMYPLEHAKAWKEMIHRYFAGTLGILILVIFLKAIQRRDKIILPFVLLCLVIFQAALGMWTVTLKLHPLIVMLHLLGGFATLGLLAWLALGSGWGEHPSQGRRLPAKFWQYDPSLHRWAFFGLILLALQVSLGGWTSANNAAFACTDFPTCQGQWWPEMNFREAFIFWSERGVDDEFGILDYPSRVAIHMMHRLGAIVVFFYLNGLGITWMCQKNFKSLRALGMILTGLVWLQIVLGISNVLMARPLAIAVAHNAGAVLLFLTLLAASFLNSRRFLCFI